MSDKVQDVTDQNFEEEVLNSSQPVLVDFWAQWCAPCRMLAPTIDQIAEEFSGRAKVVKLNVDDNMGTSSKYNIRGIPTLLLFKDGEIKDQVVGSASGANISRMIEAQLQQTADV
jgi:thioredoxin 1